MLSIALPTYSSTLYTGIMMLILMSLITVSFDILFDCSCLILIHTFGVFFLEQNLECQE